VIRSELSRPFIANDSGDLRNTRGLAERGALCSSGKSVAILTSESFPEMPDWTPEPDREASWRIYEKIVADTYEEYPDCEVIRDHKVVGKSGVCPAD